MSAKQPGLPAERGVAVIQVLLLLTVLAAASTGMAMLTILESSISRHHRIDREAAYAAEAMLALVLQELEGLADWNGVLAGTAAAGFADGPATVPRAIPGAGTVLVCCAAGSLSARLERDTGMPWRPFAWGSLAGLLGLGEAGRYYLVAWVADDRDDGDGDAAADSNNRILVRSEAVTPLGARKAIEAAVERPGGGAPGPARRGLRVLTWRERR